MANIKKVASLLAKKRKISKEIEDLQKECNHSNKSIKSIKENEDSSTFIIRWICKDCESVVGIPNDVEINKYLNGTR
jgi:SMC interacting uncharacterized protein involved in chromosome segregation